MSGFETSPPSGPAVENTEIEPETFKKDQGETETATTEQSTEVPDPFRVSQPASDRDLPDEFEDEQPTEETQSEDGPVAKTSTHPEDAGNSSSNHPPAPDEMFEDETVQDAPERTPDTDAVGGRTTEEKDTPPETEALSEEESGGTFLDRILPNKDPSDESKPTDVRDNQSDDTEGAVGSLPPQIEAFANSEFGSWAIKMVPLVIVIFALIALLLF